MWFPTWSETSNDHNAPVIVNGLLTLPVILIGPYVATFEPSNS